MKVISMYQSLIDKFNLQKRYLGISFPMLAQKSGVSEPTLKRILSGEHPSAHFDHVTAIAKVLGIDITVGHVKNAEEMKRKQAERKARELIKLLHGNSALEGQASSKQAYERMMSKTVNELLSGPKKRLWAE